MKISPVANSIEHFASIFPLLTMNFPMENWMFYEIPSFLLLKFHLEHRDESCSFHFYVSTIFTIFILKEKSKNKQKLEGEKFYASLISFDDTNEFTFFVWSWWNEMWEIFKKYFHTFRQKLFINNFVSVFKLKKGWKGNLKLNFNWLFTHFIVGKIRSCLE